MSNLIISVKVWQAILVALVLGIGIGAAAITLLEGRPNRPVTQAELSATSTSIPPTQLPLSAATATKTSSCDAQASAERVRKSVVRVQAGSAIGTGIVVATNGLLMTNEHVVGLTRTVTVTLYGGAVTTGSVLAKDANKDLALIRLNTVPPSLSPITWGSESSLRPASRLLAWGYALNFPGEPSLTTGVFSGLRHVGGVSGADVVQTDTPLNHGNSGGPLFTECGEVIGVVSFGFEGEGLNFAIGAGDAKAYASQIASTFPSPSSTSSPSLTPEETVLLFYSLIDQRRFDAAYQLLSTRFKAQGTLQGFTSGYATTTGVYVEFARPVAGSPSTIQVSIRATDSVQGRSIVQRFVGTWTVVQEIGVWRLDSAQIQVSP